ncbi:P-loop containing nucleoside triphosphate hydrolase protein [Mycena galopus ATCC 62051]|nr:P-loop containing nucleoside triphosphate hydrolase protein [Mycena galopus ATCC 62051]
MPDFATWRSPEGEAALKTIVAAKIPIWKDGLREQQVQPILHILDGRDVILCTATGDGKSAVFTVPIICHMAVNEAPTDFPKFRGIRARPVGVVITPTKGLARNIVETLSKYNIPALAFDRENIIQAAIQRRNLVDEVDSCSFRVVCVDPEHLKSPAWFKIFDAPTFQQNLLFVCVEEAHVVREWLIFRHSYGYIGQFLRGRLRPDISVFGLSATLESGTPTTEVCQSLGFRDFTLFRFSNEHRDIQFVIQPLKHAITSHCYPQILPYLNTGRKVVVYVPSLEISTRLYIYLLRLDGSGRAGRRVRQYNALCHPDFNSETLRLMETNSHLQIIIATVALANGVHCSTIQDVLSIGMPKTLSQTEQQGSRAARLPDTTRRMVIFVQKSDITQAKKFHACQFHFLFFVSVALTERSNMDPAKAGILVETTCFNAARNRIWKNEPLKETDRDCVVANRPLPCSLCAQRANISVTFSSRTSPHPAFPTPPVASKRSPVSPALKVKKKERVIAIKLLAGFGTQIFRKEIYSEAHSRRMKSWFFPSSLQEKLADSVLRLATSADLSTILEAQGWPFRTSPHRDELWLTVTKRRTEIHVARAAEVPRPRKGRAQPKVTEVQEMEDIVSPAVELVEPAAPAHPTTRRTRALRVPVASPPASRASSPPPLPTAQSSSSQRKRALEDVTNERVAKTCTVDKRTLKELEAEFGPVRTSYRRERAR